MSHVLVLLDLFRFRIRVRVMVRFMVRVGVGVRVRVRVRVRVVGFGPHALPQSPFEMGSSVRGEQELSDESKTSFLAAILSKL